MSLTTRISSVGNTRVVRSSSSLRDTTACIIVYYTTACSIVSCSASCVGVSGTGGVTMTDVEGILDLVDGGLLSSGVGGSVIHVD
jgi:hypothetical protein